MPIGYKYVERDADSQLNWAEIGKNMSDTFAEVNRVREEKKATYSEATRVFENELYNSPQGTDQDANSFINNFAHDMIEQTRLDEKLFKSGRMSEREYTLKRQNALDGTKQLFDLQKLYQAEFEKKMQGVTSGKLQALNIFNMSTVEGFKDFANSKATINPLTNKVGLGLMENKVINGKVVRVLSKNNADVNVSRGKILQNIETLDTDATTTRIVKGFGTRKDTLYQAATINNAGTITEYLGPTFLGTLKDPVDIKIVNDMNDAINLQIGSVLSNPYNFTSVLTENTGRYDEKSFTFDIDEARKDKSKILMKIDPTTQMGVPDDKGPNYKAQYQEASDWMRTDILRKFDEEKTIKTTAQNQLQESAEARERAAAKYRPKDKDEKNADTATNMIGQLWYGDDNQVSSAITYFKGLKNDKGEILFKDIVREPKGITVVLANGDKEYVEFLDKNGTPKTQEDFIASVGPLLASQLDVSKSLNSGAYKKGAQFNAQSYGRGSTIEEFVLPADVLRKPSEEAVIDINNNLPEGFTAKDIGGTFGNDIEVTSPTGKKHIVTTKKGAAAAATMSLGLEDFIKAQQKAVEEQRLKSVNPKTKTTTTTTPVVKNNKGVGSKYN